MPIASAHATAAAKLSRHQRQSPPRPRAGRASRTPRPSTARPSTALAGDRGRAGASAHTEPFRAHRAAPSTCEAGATKHQEQSDCAFGYYKEFMDSSYTVQQPPVAVNCKTPVKWLENQCLTANRGVEYDWMNFLYDINSAPAAQRTSLGNLWQVYLTACSPPECESENLSWSALDNGAKAYYGLSDARYTRIVSSGSNFGVNH